MKQIRYMVLDTETDLLVDDCTSQDDAIERAGDHNRTVALWWWLRMGCMNTPTQSHDINQ